MDAGYRDTVPAEPLGEVPFRPGDSIDRFTVLDVLGVGGMGVVLSAYDGSLDRKVAIKVLRPDRLATDREQGRIRLLREAQAMARLSHPNVITVHEVGTVGEQVFVAMELVDGETLADWLDRKKPTWREVVRVFVQAGRGLAAAHRAGLVHRDFKPENVLVGADGQVRVTDFGLVGVPAGSPAVETSAMLAAPLTRTGAVLGTPAYMSLEQHRSEEADARSDQFSFCVALHEALHGIRPFAGDTVQDIAEAIANRRFTTPVAEAPRWLRPLVLRGLEPARDDRWPSMEALLEVLERDPEAARRRRILWGGGIAAAAAALAGLFFTRETPALCQGAAAQAVAVWDEAARRQTRAAFLSTGSPIAADVFDRVDRLLAARLQGWAEAHTEACRATRVRGEQSEAMLDLRMQCLDRARRQIGGLVSLWQAGPVDLEKAIDAAGSAGDVATCADTEALAMPVAPPRDPALVQKIDRIRSQLDGAEARRRGGHLTAGLSLAREAVAAARPLGFAPLLAEALYLDGVLECTVGQLEAGIGLLREAARAAGEAHDDARAARVATVLVGVLADDGKRPAEAEAMSTFAEAAVARAGNRDELVVELLRAQASLLTSQGRPEESVERLRPALRRLEQRLGPDHRDVSRLTVQLASNLGRLGQNEEAILLLRRVLASNERRLGPDHPGLTYVLRNLSNALELKGELDEATRLAERALAIARKAYPPGHPVIADGLSALAGRRFHQGKREEARALYEEAEKIRLAALGPDHPDTASVRGNLAGLAVDRGDTATARSLLESVIAAKTRTLGENHPDLAHWWATLGQAWWKDKDLKEAEAAYARALAIWRAQKGERVEIVEGLMGLGWVRNDQERYAEAVQLLEEAKATDERLRGPRSAYRRMILVALGVAYLGTGPPAIAVQWLEEAAAITDRERPGTGEQNRVRFFLARALWAHGAHSRARALARGVRDRLSGPEDREDRLTVEKWLRAHGGGRRRN